ncbi:MAG: fused MFS/spermidine synthase [Bacteroidetes bacterium]|nr:fused MFS/spermidine synthase [Bacteroidota bacterium]
MVETRNYKKSATKKSLLTGRLKRYIYLLLLIEGGSLMAVELIGAKLIASYYGNSLYVWTAVLSVTLGGIAIGYYFGGVLSSKFPDIKKLLIIISISVLLVFIMPHTSDFIMTATLDLELRLGILISCLFFLMPPLICFGMVGPFVVRLASTEMDKVGKVAGTVYFISTVGGIIATFLFGFYLIPFWGLKLSTYTIAIALAVLPLLYFFNTESGKEKSIED